MARALKMMTCARLLVSYSKNKATKKAVSSFGGKKNTTNKTTMKTLLRDFCCGTPIAKIQSITLMIYVVLAAILYAALITAVETVLVPRLIEEGKRYIVAFLYFASAFFLICLALALNDAIAQIATCCMWCHAKRQKSTSAASLAPMMALMQQHMAQQASWSTPIRVTEPKSPDSAQFTNTPLYNPDMSPRPISPSQRLVLQE